MTQSAWVEANGVSLRYALSGEGGPVVVLIHEMGGSIESFDHIVGPLQKKCRVLRYDLRNCGLSERVQGPMEIGHLVSDLAAILDALNIDQPIVVAGSALGGGIAAAFAAARSNRVAALIMMSAATGLSVARKAAALERADEVERSGLRPTNDSRLMTSFPPSMRTDAGRFEDVRLRRLATDPFAISSYTRLLAAMDLDHAMTEVQCPTLVLAGRHDQDRPPEVVDRATAAIGNRRFNILDTGHFMSLQTPEAVSAQIIDFLSEIGFLKDNSAS